MTADAPPLALGTVQFGVRYGIAGRGAPVPHDEARAILEDVAAGGVTLLDTAPGYGDIESRLGDLAAGLPFDIVSKIPAVPADGGEIDAFVQHSIERSRERLGDRLVALLFHRPEDLLGANADRAWNAAVGAAGPIPVGISAYGPDQVVEARRRFPVAVAQLPGNAFDQRLNEPGVAEALAGVELHLRSVFLQGLLLMPRAAARERVPAAAGALDRWARWCDEYRREPLDAALAIAASLPGVRYRVVGVDSRPQWQQIAAAADRAGVSAAPALASHDSAIIDPRRWPALTSGHPS